MMDLRLLRDVKMTVPNDKDATEHLDNAIQRVFRWMAGASVLLFILLAIVASDGSNGMSWLHPIMGPFGFLRGDSWAHPARTNTMVVILVLVVLYGIFYKRIHVRSLLFFLIVFCWSAIGFISFLVHEGRHDGSVELLQLNVCPENLLRHEDECHK